MNPSTAGGDGARHEARSRSQRSDLDTGWVYAVELVTATLTWGGIGWLVDSWLGTGPWLMSAGFVVGNGAGIYLLWLRTNQAEPDRGAGAGALGQTSADRSREGVVVAEK